MTNTDFASSFSQKKILVTGACGTVGKELISQLLSDTSNSPSLVIGIDNNESSLFFIDQQYSNDPRVHFYLLDIRDKDSLIRISKNVDIIFHAAALKHVGICEKSPSQALQTNINGVENIIEASFFNDVEKVIFTSSDKAVNPTNVMGTSKLMGERLITAANSNKRHGGPIFASTRFGNVLGSNGSVVPIFHSQIAKGGPVTVTSVEMTRFVMSITESVKLVLDSANLAVGGEVFVTKMPTVRIIDLAQAMIDELAPVYGHDPNTIKIEIIGMKPGEKLYEELMNTEETRRTLELSNYFSVLPAFESVASKIEYSYPDILSHSLSAPYVSSEETSLTVPQIKNFLHRNSLLPLTRS